MNADSHGKSQAIAQLNSVRELVSALRAAREMRSEDMQSQDNLDGAEQAIHEDALSVEVRDGWRCVGETVEGPESYRIVLCTGGPHVEIRGELDRFNEPETARLSYQDWGTPLTDLELSSDDEAVLLDYARVFYFGE